MTITKRTKKYKKINTNTYQNEYVRNVQWLPMPNVVEGEQVFYGLHAIRSNNEYVTVTATVNNDIGDQYIVDWGDGTIESINDNTTAEHIYDINTYDIFNKTLTSDGYKQVIIKVIPKGTANLNSVSTEVPHSVKTGNYASGWLDILMCGKYIQRLYLSNSGNVNNVMLEHFEFIGENIIDQLSYAFSGCHGLKKISQLYTKNVLDATFAFDECYNLIELPTLDLTNCTNIGNMFHNCFNLRKSPKFINTSNLTSIQSLFHSCKNLVEVELFDTSTVTTSAGMFSYCEKIQNIPNFNFASVTDANSMFDNCFNLVKIPFFNMPNVTNVSYMFSACHSLISVPAFNLTNCTGVNSTEYIFDQIWALSSVNLLNIKTNTDISNGNLSVEEITKIFTNLATVVNKSITIAGNPGVADLTAGIRLIATAKGWTIVE